MNNYLLKFFDLLEIWGLGIGDWAQSPIPIYINEQQNKRKLINK